MFKIIYLKIRYSKGYVILRNNYFLLAIAITLLLLTFSNIIYIFFLLCYIIYLYKKEKFLFIFGLILIIIISLHYFLLEFRKPYRDDYVKGEVISTESNQFIIKSKNKKILIFNYIDYNLKAGMKVKILGEMVIPDENHIEGSFNYRKYLWHKKIDGVINANEIKIIDRGFNIGLIRDSVNRYFERSFSGLSLSFLKALLLGDKNYLDIDFSNSLINNGIIHLFAISGLHITLFIGLLLKLFNYFELKEQYANSIVIIFLGIYLIITNFSPSIVRAALMYFFSILNKKHKLGLSSLDIASVVFLILILINPFYMYDVGFILSFIVCFVIILGNSLVNGNNIKEILLISTFAQIATFPIIINLNNEINILSPLVNIVFLLFIEVIILPFPILLVFFPLLQGLYNYLVLFFSKLSIFCANNISIMIKFRAFNNYHIIGYYLIIILFLIFYFNKKIRKILLGCFCIFIVFLYNYNIFIPYGEINFLDLYNGESIVIIQSHNQGVVVIDTGDGTNNEVTSFLKRKGIRTIDLLIITHNHRDHNGEAINIINEFNINNIILSAYDSSELKNMHNVITVKKGSKLCCGNLRFDVLHPDKAYHNENDNSIVLTTNISGKRYLFMGDATKNVENNFSHLDVDVIKIGHHGSATSTSSAFIASVIPRYAIIQTGRIDYFGFPNQNVIATLNEYNVKTFRTDLNYSVKVRYYKNRCIFITLK